MLKEKRDFQFRDLLWLSAVLLCLFPGTPADAEIEIHQGKMTAKLSSEPLNSVIELLRQQHDIQVFVEETIGSQTISAEFDSLPIATAIRKMLEGTGVNFAVVSGTTGEVQRIFIGLSEKPGAPPRRLDNRPVNAPRGVVTPVNPPPAQMNAPEPTGRPQRQGGSDLELPPTGGGYAPANPPQKQPPPEEEQQEQEEEQQ